MSDDKFYKDGDVVWVKLGNNWWPGEVTGINRQPEGLLKHLKRKPFCVVKFFQEDSYEYVKSSKQIFPYNCNKKDEFTKKGLALFNAKNKFMEKFPGDVEIAERLTRRAMESDMLIINDRPDSIVKAILGQTLTRATNDYYGHDGRSNNTNTRRSGDSITKILNITPNRTNETTTSNAIFGGGGCTITAANSTTPTTLSSGVPANDSSAAYRCNLCNFTSLRQNVMIFHRKTHSGSNITTTTTPVSVAKITPNKEIKEKLPSSTLPAGNTNKSSIEIATTTTTPLSSKAAVTVPSRNVVAPTLEDSYAPTKLSRTTRKEETSSKTSTPSTSLTAVSKAPHLPSTAESVSSTPTLCNEETKSTVQTPSPPKGTKKKDKTSALALTKRSLRSSPPEVVDESTTLAANDITTRTTINTTLENDSKTNSNVTELTIEAAADIDELKPKRNSEDIIRSWQAEWSDEEESMTTPMSTPKTTIDATLPSVTRLKTTESEEPLHTVAESAIKPEDASPVVAVCTPPVVTSRIRNIPKKDRRDIILKEFPPLELNTSNSQSSVSLTPPVVVTIVDSGSSSNSSSSESVVVVDELPTAAVVEVLDVIDVDAIETSKTQTTASVSGEIAIYRTTELELEPDLEPELEPDLEPELEPDLEPDLEPELEPESEAVPTPLPPAAATFQTWSCFDFQEEDNDSDLLTSITKFKKKHLSPDKNSPTENPTPQTVAIKKSDEDLELKDKQLSAEIETLLFQSKSTVVDMTAVASKEDVPVKALPIKERGKRIFKSRNRSRVEDALSVGGTNATVATNIVNVSNSDENIPAEVATEEAILINHATLAELQKEEIQAETKQTTELGVEDNLDQLSVEVNDKIESENENIKSLEENNSKVLDAVGVNLELSATLEAKTSSLFETNIEEELNKSLSDVGKPSVVRVSDVKSEIENEKETEVEQEPKIDIVLDGKNIFDDEVIPVIKHAPVEIFKEESTTVAENNILDQTAVAVNADENSANIEMEQPKNFKNSDRAVTPAANLLKEEINKTKDIQDGEEREQSLVLPLQVNTNNELENDTTSRFTSPTDENSSIGISEAGAEFGSPTSMLDDERLPIVASNLMTGIERQEHNTNLEEIEGEAHDVSNIEQTVVESINYIKEEEKEKSSETIGRNYMEHPSENKDLLTDQSLKTDEITLNKQTPVQSVEEATTEDDEIESPPHEMLLSGNELEEELKKLKTTKKIKTRNKGNSRKTNNLNKDGLNNKIKETAIEEDVKKKEDKKEREEEKEKEVKEIHKQQHVRTTRQSVQKLALEVLTKKENKKPQVTDKNESVNKEVLENKNISTLKDRGCKEKTKKRENNTTFISNDKTEKGEVEVINENKFEAKDLTEPAKSTDVEGVRKEPTANETFGDNIETSVETNDFHKTDENDTKNREATMIDIATKSSEFSSKPPKKDIIEELALLINISEVSESNQALETEKTFESLAANKEPVETEKPAEAEENIRTEVVQKNINFIETENIKELEAEDNKEIKIENNKETATRKRRSHIKITPRKRNAETPLATETTMLNTKVESKSSQTEAKMRKKSNEIELKTVNSTPIAQTSISTIIADVATPKDELKTDEEIDVAPVDKENEIDLEKVTKATITTTASNTTATTSKTLSEMRSFRPRRKTNHFETGPVLTTATDVLKCENEKTTPADEDRQLTTSLIASHELASANIDEKEILSTVPTAVEKVRINVDVANPLSSQIANILATSSGQQQNLLHSKKLNMSSLPATTSISKTTLTIPLKRKKSIEDDIPSFIIERPCSATAAAASVTVANAAEKEAFAHVQNKCPQVKITRKEKMIETDLSPTNPVKVAQSLHSPTQMFILNPTVKHQQLGNVESGDAAAMFDIGNMPILLSNEQLLGSSSAENVHIVITPTAAANVIESIVTDTGDEQQLSPASGVNQTSILMHVVPTNAAKSSNDGPKIIKQQILQVAHQQPLVEAATKQEQLQQQHEQNQQINIKTRKPASNTRTKRLPSRQQQQQIHEVNETEEDRKKKLKTDQQSLTPHQRQLQEQQRVLQLQKQQQHNVGSQTSNKQIGIDSRGNKYVIIKTNQPPTDLVVQQQLQPPLLEQTVIANQTKIQNAVAATASSSFSIGTGVTVRAIGETETSVEGTIECQEQQLLQQPKQKSPAAAATGGRKQAGNIITLPSNAAVKQQQHQFTESMQIATEATVPTNMLSSPSSSSQFMVQQKTNTNSKNLSTLATSNKRTKSSQLSQQQVQQQEIAGTKKLLTTKDKKPGGKSSGISNASGNRRLSAIESSLPTKIAKTSVHNSFTGDVIGAQQQQQQQTSQPPPLHHLQNRKVKKQQQQQQQQNRSASVNSNKKESTNINESNDLLRAISQQQQQPSTSSSLSQQQLQQQQQQQSVHSTTISEEQLMQIQSEDQIDGTSKILAVPTQPIHGYNETFLLCTLVNNNYKPIDNVPLYLDHDLNQLVPVPLEALDGQPNLIVNHPPPEDIVNQLHTPQSSSQQQKQNEQLQQHSAASTSSPSSVRNTPSTSLTSVEADSSTQMLCLQSSAEGNNHADITEVVPSILEPITHTSAVVNDDSDEAQMAVYIPPECNAELPTDNAVILNIEGQQIILDAATFAHLLANPDANTQLVTDDGTEFVLTREVLAALEAQQDSQDEAAAEQHLQQQLQQTHQITEAGPTDILAVALAGSDLYGNEVLEIETSQGLQLVGADGIVFQSSTLPHQHLTPPITAQTSETNALLNQTPIMSTLEKPSTSGKRKPGDNAAANLFGASVSLGDLPPNCRPNLEDSLAVIGVTTSSSSVPTSLELPITVTNPAIAPKSTMAGPTAPVGLSSTSSVVVTESVQFQCLPHRTGGMAAGETRIYNDPGS